ncbi:hypothetical protein NFH66_14215 [Halomonas sp. H10-9-1]
MVAMLIGLVIILGAGQLFLTVFTTRERVETLGEKQAALNFAVESLVRDMRRADGFEITEKDGNDALKITLPNSRGECKVGEVPIKTYWVEKGELDDYYLNLKLVCSGDEQWQEELVGGFSGPLVVKEESEAGLEEEKDYGVRVTFNLKPTDGEGEPDSFSFYAINHSKVVQDVFDGGDDNGGNGGNGDPDNDPDPTTTPDPDRPGYYLSGEEMYGPNCYNSKGYKGGCD